MKLTILGSGASTGVPKIFCDCDVCVSKNQKNRRLRSSSILESDSGETILIDSSPDIREQILYYNKNISAIKKLDALLYTHVHADHVNGIEDLRAFNVLMNSTIQCYSASWVLDLLQNIYGYIFSLPSDVHLKKYGKWSRCSICANSVGDYDIFFVGDLKIETILQQHGIFNSLGFIFNDRFAYCTDVNMFYDQSLEILRSKKLDLLVLGCLRDKKHNSHMCWDEAIDFIRSMNVKKTILTHMSHEVDYDVYLKRCQELDIDVVPAYDMITLEF